MDKKQVFVCYDHETDGECRSQLEAWSADSEFDFIFNDLQLEHIDVTNIVQAKVQATVRINSASHTLVIIGRDANRIHRHQNLLGFRNWINFEIHQSRLHGNKIVALRLQNDYEYPEELSGAGATWALAFSENKVIKALQDA